MPHKNINERRKYSREYAKKNPQVLTDEQKKAKSEYMKEYSRKNAKKLKRYQHERYKKDKDEKTTFLVGMKMICYACCRS